MPDPIPDQPEPLRLWLTSRSAYEDGFFCPRSRYLQYHSGPFGYGIRRKAESIPLVTGGSIHQPLAELLTWIMHNPTDMRGADQVLRAACGDSCAKYVEVVASRGLANLTEDETLKTVIAEQKLLIHALPWCWTLEALDDFLDRYELVSVEQVEELVVDCTCGLGDSIGSFRDHHNRTCEGIGIMGRLDVIARSKATRELIYVEFKTMSSGGRDWELQWADKLQFVMGVAAAEARLDEVITEHAVYGLIKGSRQHIDRMPDGTYGGPIIQNTPLVYPYCNPGSPPVEPEQWEAQYETEDELTGQTRRLGRKYKKRLLTENQEATEAAAGEGMPLGEYWTRIVHPAVRKKHVTYVGPLRIQPVMRQKLLNQIIPTEREWQRKAWAIYEAYDAANGEFDNPEFQKAMDEHAPCSWNCKQFGKRYACQFHKLCFQEVGWQDPLGSDYYLPRRPHHEAELKQAQARGLIPPDEGLERTEDEE
jgi:hypothetical protein